MIFDTKALSIVVKFTDDRFDLERPNRPEGDED